MPDNTAAARQHDGQPRGAVGANEPGQPRQRAPEDVPIQEEDGRKRLVLCRGAHPPDTGERRQELLHLGGAELAGVPLAVEHHELLRPPDVRLLGPRAVVPHPDRLTQGIQQPRPRRNHLFGHATLPGTQERPLAGPGKYGETTYRDRGQCVERLPSSPRAKGRPTAALERRHVCPDPRRRSGSGSRAWDRRNYLSGHVMAARRGVARRSGRGVAPRAPAPPPAHHETEKARRGDPPRASIRAQGRRPEHRVLRALRALRTLRTLRREPSDPSRPSTRSVTRRAHPLGPAPPRARPDTPSPAPARARRRSAAAPEAAAAARPAESERAGTTRSPCRPG
jgi:hypothetical protein